MANEKLTITLTGARPVTISKADWPILAEASDKEFDNEFEFQANRISKWTLKVRQHADGRSIVYGIYDYNTNWQGERGRNVRGGVLIASGEDIPAAIREVAADLESRVGDGVFLRLAHECTADLPAVEI